MANGFDVKITLNKKDRDKILAYPKEVREALLPTFEKFMMKAEGISKEQYFKNGGPVDPKILTARSGNLRRIITHEVELTGTKIKASLEADLDYAMMHEYGEDGMPARPFLTPAIQDVLDENILETILMDEINKRIGS